jgi:hypothetical protein
MANIKDLNQQQTLLLINGVIVDILIKHVKGRRALPVTELMNSRAL